MIAYRDAYGVAFVHWYRSREVHHQSPCRDIDAFAREIAIRWSMVKFHHRCQLEAWMLPAFASVILVHHGLHVGSKTCLKLIGNGFTNILWFLSAENNVEI